MTPQLIYNHSIEDSDIHNLCEDLVQYSDIAPKYYERFDVKRGLRNADGSGVIAGITRICMVHGYVMSEGERQPIPGQLIYRGYDINDLIENAEREDRYVFEEVAYLLLFGRLPNGADLERMTRSLGVRRELPPGFLVDSIMQSPSNNIMNKLARSILSLYSYSDVTENTTIEDEMSIALDLIAKMPILMDGAYQAKRHKYDNASLIMHPLRPEENTAESILSLIRNDRSYTKAEAQLLDTLLALHADHGGGNNSTFACRVATSSGTDPFAAYTSAINSHQGHSDAGRHQGTRGTLGERGRSGRLPHQDPPEGSQRRLRSDLRYGPCGIYAVRPPCSDPEAESNGSGCGQGDRTGVQTAGYG